jgi:hypothetical protein
MIRPIVTLHLPLEMGAVGRICAAVAREYPDATVSEGFVIQADDDFLTKAQRREIAKRRREGVSDARRQG